MSHAFPDMHAVAHYIFLDQSDSKKMRLSSTIHDRISAQYLCPQFSIMDTNFQPILSTNERGHYRQNPLEFKPALVALSLKLGLYLGAGGWLWVLSDRLHLPSGVFAT